MWWGLPSLFSQAVERSSPSICRTVELLLYVGVTWRQFFMLITTTNKNWLQRIKICMRRTTITKFSHVHFRSKNNEDCSTGCSGSSVHWKSWNVGRVSLNDLLSVSCLFLLLTLLLWLKFFSSSFFFLLFFFHLFFFGFFLKIQQRREKNQPSLCQ